MKQTPNYNLPQFDGEDLFNKEDFNDAFKKIDTAISDLQDSINMLEQNAVQHIKDLKKIITKSEESNTKQKS